MIINDLEKGIFNKAIADIKDAFKMRSQEDIESIGLDTLGISALIADWCVTESGTSSATWIKHLNWAVSIAQGQHVMNNLEAFVALAEHVFAQGGCSPETAIDIGGIDKLAYCHKDKDKFTLWVETQSSAFIYKLSRLKVYENSVYIDACNYSAREITQKEWNKSKVSPKAFELNDSRDKGYCGTLESGCAIEIKDGFYYTKEFSRAFEVLWFAKDQTE